MIATTSASAERVVPMILDLVRPGSVVDVGCGAGVWLKEFARAGLTDLLGLDGDYVDMSLWQLPRHQFRATDVSAPINVERSFDLAVCLEVAEHLTESSARTLVNSLTRLAPAVVFSAAVPHQGGIMHFNEQLPGYWAAIFDQQNYRLFDCFRPALWNDKKVLWYYRSNMFLYIREDCVPDFSHLETHLLRPDHWSMFAMHPDLYETLLRETDPSCVSVKHALSSFVRTLSESCKRKLSRA
jgi:SAM-dependent methyltransferase